MTAGIIISAIIIALALIVAVLWFLGSRAKRKLAAQYPPPGQMVDVGGFRMHIDCRGDPAAGPAVVMDSGNGEPAMAWTSVTFSGRAIWQLSLIYSPAPLLGASHSNP